jgi:hypothetical protein
MEVQASDGFQLSATFTGVTFTLRLVEKSRLD